MPPRMGLVREVVLALWRQAVVSERFATDHIAAAFRQDRRIGSQERRLIAETLYGMLRQYRRLLFALEAGPAPREAQAEALYVAYRLLEGMCSAEEAARELSGVDWAAVRAVGERIEREADPVVRLGLRRSLPDWLARALLAEYGEEADALAEALNRRAPLTVRANTLKVSRDGLAERLRQEGIETEPCRHAPHGLRFVAHQNAFGLAAFREGLFEVQDEASQLVALLVAPVPDGTVVDACAGAGGKTLALAAAMGNRGRLFALDVSRDKLAELARRARRAGVSNLEAAWVPADRYPARVEAMCGRMRRVLADVPCSGIGALRRNPEARWRLGEEELARFPGLQADIAMRAARLLAPLGRLVYATCTVLRPENEEVVERVLAGRGELERVRPAEILGGRLAAGLCDRSGWYLKLLPHRHDTDGFFAAVLRRRKGA